MRQTLLSAYRAKGTGEPGGRDVAKRIREYGVKRPEWLTHCEICGCAIGDYKEVDSLIEALGRLREEVLDRFRGLFPNMEEDRLLKLLKITPTETIREIADKSLLLLAYIWQASHQAARLVQCPVCGRFVCVIPAAPELDCWDERRGMCVLCAEEMPRQKACPNCGAVMPQEARFCGICGYRLSEG